MTSVSRVQVIALAKYLSLFLVGITLLGALASYMAVGTIILSWPIFLLNLVGSCLLAWYFYKQRAHQVLSYDDHTFQLDTGRQRIRKEWRQFSAVSLVHKGGGDFALRLHGEDEKNLDLPVSALGLNPQEFRFRVMQYVRGEEAEGNRLTEQISADPAAKGG
jgi:hypothetical protein